ncbi:hypothetical protein LX36DRAFT_303233 [Colletotrichum falcatum]|nr:hypothetical protein LX36DRAFT_303233 [Colletotrichum falcatum]
MRMNRLACPLTSCLLVPWSPWTKEPVDLGEGGHCDTLVDAPETDGRVRTLQFTSLFMLVKQRAIVDVIFAVMLVLHDNREIGESGDSALPTTPSFSSCRDVGTGKAIGRRGHGNDVHPALLLTPSKKGGWLQPPSFLTVLLEVKETLKSRGFRQKEAAYSRQSSSAASIRQTIGEINRSGLISCLVRSHLPSDSFAFLLIQTSFRHKAPDQRKPA